MTLRRFLKSIKTNTKVEKKILNLNLYNKYYIRSNNIKLNEIVLFLDNNNNVIICLDFMKKIKDVIDIKTPQYTVSYPLFTFKNQNLSFQLPHFRNLKVEAQKLNFIFKNFKSILKKKKIKALLISSIRGGYLLYCCGVRGFMPTSAYNFFSKNLQINDFSNYNFYFLSWFKVNLTYIKVTVRTFKTFRYNTNSKFIKWQFLKEKKIKVIFNVNINYLIKLFYQKIRKKNENKKDRKRLKFKRIVADINE